MGLLQNTIEGIYLRAKTLAKATFNAYGLYFALGAFPLIIPVCRNLEYEFGFVLALTFLIAFPYSALRAGRSYLFSSKLTDSHVVELAQIFGPRLLAWLLPGALAYLIQDCPCSASNTLFWVVVQGLPSYIFGHAAYHALAKAVDSGHSRTKVGALFALLQLGIALLVILQIWGNPQVRMVHPLVGFLHGPLYDQWIPIDYGVILLRGFHLFIALAALQVSLSLFSKRAHRVFLTGLVTAGLLTAFIGSSYPTAQMGTTPLQSLLSGRLSDPRFDLFFKPKRDGGLPGYVKRIAADATFHIADFEAQSGARLAKPQIYVYPNDDLKKLWFGGGSTDVTDVHTPSIHISGADWPHRTLRHELVHALFSKEAFFGLGFHPNMAITEGLAVALAPNERSHSLDYGVATMIHEGTLPDIDKLFGPLFWLSSGSNAYTVAGSLIQYLKDEFGLQAVLKLYNGGSWEESFRKSRPDIVEAWKKAVTEKYPDRAIDLAEKRKYVKRGILDGACPHSKHTLAIDATRKALVRLRQPPGWDHAVDYYPWRLRIDPKDDLSQIAMWRAGIKQDMQMAGQNEPKLNTWLEIILGTLDGTSTTIYDYEAGLLAADLLKFLGRDPESRELLESLLESTSVAYPGDSLYRQILARDMVEHSLSLKESLAFRRYLAGMTQDFPNVRVEDKDPWIKSYLAIRNQKTQQSKDPRFLKESLKRFLNPSISASFRYEWFKWLGIRLFKLEQFESAELAFEKARAVDRGRNNDFIELLSVMARDRMVKDTKKSH